MTTQQEWFSAQEAADLLSMSKAGLLKKAKTEAWQSRPRQGKGGGKEYHLTSLPPETQAYLLKQRAAAKLAQDKATKQTKLAKQPLNADDAWYDPEDLWDYYGKKPQKQKDKAEAKLPIFHAMIELMRQGVKQIKAIEMAAEGSPWAWKTLNDVWHGKPGKPGLKFYRTCDWLAALVPGYTGKRRQPMDVEIWDTFMAMYMRQEHPSIKDCYIRLQRQAESRGWDLPRYEIFVDREKQIPLPEKVLARKGYEALRRLFPHVDRTVAGMHALDHINGDGYEHNRMVRFPDGEVTRPKTWFWQDIYSRMILGYRINKTENTDSIRVSFGEIVEKFGIPNHVTIDNTRAAANKTMTGGMRNRYRFKVKPDDPDGIFKALDIDVHWTQVDEKTRKGNGQAKPIERAFGVGGLGEVIDKHPKFPPGSYTGNGPKDKPENFKKGEYVDYDTFVAVVEEEIKYWNARLGRRSEMAANEKSFEQVFNESYARSTIRKASAMQRRLWLLPSEPVTVYPDGSIYPKAGSSVGIGKNRYHSETLLQFRGSKVVVRFDPDDLHKDIAVFTLDNRYICDAQLLQAVGFRDVEGAREHNRAKNQFRKATKKRLDAMLRMDALEAARYEPKAPEPETPSAGAVKVEFEKVLKVSNGGDLPDADEKPSHLRLLENLRQPTQEEVYESNFNEAMKAFRKDV